MFSCTWLVVCSAVQPYFSMVLRPACSGEACCLEFFQLVSRVYATVVAIFRSLILLVPCICGSGQDCWLNLGWKCFWGFRIPRIQIRSSSATSITREHWLLHVGDRKYWLVQAFVYSDFIRTRISPCGCGMLASRSSPWRTWGTGPWVHDHVDVTLRITPTQVGLEWSHRSWWSPYLNRSTYSLLWKRGKLFGMPLQNSSICVWITTQSTHYWKGEGNIITADDVRFHLTSVWECAIGETWSAGDFVPGGGAHLKDGEDVHATGTLGLGKKSWRLCFEMSLLARQPNGMRILCAAFLGKDSRCGFRQSPSIALQMASVMIALSALYLQLHDEGVLSLEFDVLLSRPYRFCIQNMSFASSQVTHWIRIICLRFFITHWVDVRNRWSNLWGRNMRATLYFCWPVQRFTS